MYDVVCPNCKASFDALQAKECHCLQPLLSYDCPHCSKCFCEAGKEFIDRFWREAPPEMWDRRRAKDRAPQRTKETNEPPDTIARPVVLFADDDSVGRAIARRVLHGLGCGIVVASNGEEALALAREYKPALVITDALMPRLDGREVARVIKEERPDTKIVIITSVYKDPRYKHEAYSKFGVDAYLSKPVSAPDLRALVEKHLLRDQAPQGGDDIIF